MDGRTFFLNGSAGTGKTFLYNTVAASCRLRGYIVLTVASSGIASLPLVGGRTAHSTFKIPIEINVTSVWSIPKQSSTAKFLKEAKLIIWDEVPMQHRFCVESVNRLLKNIRGNELAFGGITVVMGGDFRQTLPVIPNGGRADVVGACVRRSVLWNNITVLTLIKNMRLDLQDPENKIFSEFLLKVGTEPEEKVQLPSSVNRCKDMEDLICKLYPRLSKIHPHSGTSGQVSEEELTERIILSARNNDINEINMEALNILEGETFTYLAADKLNPDESCGIPNFTNEFLQNLNP
ncbi:uncharacterized protein LOC113355393 [Papaver somniferum]|uniref:uncharacterized protein LOC113355393 n=1 Tax=Papaver somniferum TaxID=3469 RepID=UPI000E6FF751|nr:uncharacterized protein LOC113355393 [Papaver somniferum]